MKYFSDVFLLNLFLIYLLDVVGQVVVKVDAVGTDKDDVSSNRIRNAVWQAKPVKEDHLPYIKIFRVIKSVAIEAFDEGFVAIVPEVEGIGSGDQSHPLFFGMQGSNFNLIGSHHIDVEELLLFAGHLMYAV